MNKEVEELLQYLRINISDEDEFIQIASIVITIKQAFSNMERDREQVKYSTGVMLGIKDKLQSKLDKVREVIEHGNVYGTTQEEHDKILKIEQILKEE